MSNDSGLAGLRHEGRHDQAKVQQQPVVTACEVETGDLLDLLHAVVDGLPVDAQRRCRLLHIARGFEVGQRGVAQI